MSRAHPNVIIVITDDQGYGDLGCHGNPVACTPCLDRLHDESVRCGDFHAAPMCTPSRGQLMTGLDAARNGAVNVSSGRTLLRADLRTVADHFRDNGYATGIFGKWHLGDNYPYRPQDRGFDESLWFPSSHINSLPDYWNNDYFDDVYCHNGEREHYEGYCTDVFFREATKWMQPHIESGRPFFAYLPTNAPHAPLWVPPEDRAIVKDVFSRNEHLLPSLKPELRENIIRFLAMIHTVDRHVGALRDFLRQQNAERDTILIFMTDNGSTFGPAYYNAGMRGTKCSLWEGGHRVPCFLHWPGGNLGEPREIDGLTQMQDVLPTLADLCGLELAPDTPLDGTSLAPALRDAEPVPDRILCVNYSFMHSLDYPTPDCKSIMRREYAAVMWKRWRLLEETALYDLDTDPLQERDIADKHPDIVRTMAAALHSWWAEVEPVANQVQRITVGSPEENPTMLSACDWMDVFMDQQFQVRIGSRKNSYWHLQIAREGTYRFELSRWPRESGLGLRDGCPAYQPFDGEPTAEGAALPIARARMMVARTMHAVDVGPDDTAAVFTVPLDAGPVLLHTWFQDERQNTLCGAYYVQVTRVEEAV